MLVKVCEFGGLLLNHTTTGGSSISVSDQRVHNLHFHYAGGRCPHRLRTRSPDSIRKCMIAYVSILLIFEVFVDIS